jgi:hypothetical protein
VLANKNEFNDYNIIDKKQTEDSSCQKDYFLGVDLDSIKKSPSIFDSNETPKDEKVKQESEKSSHSSLREQFKDAENLNPTILLQDQTQNQYSERQPLEISLKNVNINLNLKTVNLSWLPSLFRI